MVSSSQTIYNQADCEDEEEISLKKRNGKRLWKKVKYQLIEYHSLPPYLRDNEYILSHYRCEWPLKQLLLSIFTIHNETLNVWTHLIGFFLFLSLAIYTATTVPDVMEYYPLQHLAEMLKKAGLHDVHSTLWSVKDNLLNTIAPLAVDPITRWPFYAFLGGAMFCLLASSACHLLCCHSERLSYIMLRFDYAGIAALITTSFYPPVYYSFMCNLFFCNLYLSLITILGIATIVFSLSPVFQNPEYRSIRASLFFGMGISGVAPIFHKLILYRHQPEALQTTGYEILMGAFYGIGALIYAKRIPERWWPGKFDIAGHSHSIFHILVVAGAYTHYHTGLLYLKWRDVHGC
ncbi:heptahelical transmembrane protein 4 isoform X4 [Spinacia oleracea]|uniref:Heptahelical transmembrane protein 4 isoform X4 n=1 Tax=Spinacia oleracea TaxID=3562 RepID=A0A9R0IMJ2_SPIOL|nr:heptahelical transmembrane protein 4-like isoform X4 [Spinacia oleracea]